MFLYLSFSGICTLLGNLFFSQLFTFTLDIFSFAQTQPLKMSFRGILLTLILWVHFRTCTLLLLLEYRSWVSTSTFARLCLYTSIWTSICLKNACTFATSAAESSLHNQQQLQRTIFRIIIAWRDCFCCEIWGLRRQKQVEKFLLFPLNQRRDGERRGHKCCMDAEKEPLLLSTEAGPFSD